MITSNGPVASMKLASYSLVSFSENKRLRMSGKKELGYRKGFSMKNDLFAFKCKFYVLYTLLVSLAVLYPAFFQMFLLSACVKWLSQSRS